MRTISSLALTAAVAALAVTVPVLAPVASYAAPATIAVGDRSGDAAPRADLVRQSVVARAEDRLETRVKFADARPFGAASLVTDVTLFTAGDDYYVVTFERERGQEPTYAVTRNSDRAPLCEGRPTIDRDRGLVAATFGRDCIGGQSVEIIAGTSDAYTARDQRLGSDSTRLSEKGDV